MAFDYSPPQNAGQFVDDDYVRFLFHKEEGVFVKGSFYQWRDINFNRILEIVLPEGVHLITDGSSVHEAKWEHYRLKNNVKLNWTNSFGRSSKFKILDMSSYKIDENFANCLIIDSNITEGFIKPKFKWRLVGGSEIDNHSGGVILDHRLRPAKNSIGIKGFKLACDKKNLEAIQIFDIKGMDTAGEHIHSKTYYFREARY